MEMNSRSVALLALERCRREKAWSDAVLDSLIRSVGLDRRDAALASRLCYGVQQNRTLCDYYIDFFSSTRSTRMEPRVLDILRISVYSLLFLDRIPERAVVNEAVSLCKTMGNPKASGLVNAVLRRIVENKSHLPSIPGQGTAEYLAIRYSHPIWLVKLFLDRLGYNGTENLLIENNNVPPVTAQINTLLNNDVYHDNYCTVHSWLPDCVILDDAGEKLEIVRSGHAYIQDPAAKLAVIAASPKPGMKVLDACSAPGGKSFAAAMLMQNEGRILACDLHEKKLSRIQNGANKLGISIIETMAIDARKADFSECFDLVIADVPCSGLGVIRKKPDIRFKEETDLSDLPAIQYDILCNVSRFVKPGGTLLYSTCTVREIENENVCRCFLSENRDFQTDSFTLPGPAGEVPSGMLTLWPHIHGTDGFFICKMKRSI